MIEFDDFEKAKQNIDSLFQLRDEINKSTPYLNDMLANIQLYEKMYQDIPEERQRFLSTFEDPIKNVLDFNPASFSFNTVTGATGSFYQTSGTTKAIIQSYGDKYYYLINEYDKINEIDKIIDRILDILTPVDADLSTLLTVAQITYSEWKAGGKTDSDLSKDIRAFQDIFKGFLNKLRINSNPELVKRAEKKEKLPEFSWPKMSNAVARKGAGHYKQLLKEKGRYDSTHLAFTQIMKGTQVVSKEDMEEIFQSYVEHAFIVLSSIDLTLI